MIVLFTFCSWLYRLDFVVYHLFVCLDWILHEVEWWLVEGLGNMYTGYIGASVAFTKLFTRENEKAISSLFF